MYSLNNEEPNLPVRLHSLSALCGLHMQNAGFFMSVFQQECVPDFSK